MGQIVKRKKKGRPSKADLARRAATAEQQEAASIERDVRRSRRRRSVRYTLDYEDFIDEDEEDDVRRREKKLKLLLKLHSKEVGSGESATRRFHAPNASASSSDDDGGDNKPLKKRKIDGNNDEVDGDDEDDENENDLNNDEEEEVRSE